MGLAGLGWRERPCTCHLCSPSSSTDVRAHALQGLPWLCQALFPFFTPCCPACGSWPVAALWAGGGPVAVPLKQAWDRPMMPQRGHHGLPRASVAAGAGPLCLVAPCTPGGGPGGLRELAGGLSARGSPATLSARTGRGCVPGLLPPPRQPSGGSPPRTGALRPQPCAPVGTILRALRFQCFCRVQCPD